MPRVVLDMMDRRPIWAMSLWVPEEIRSSLPGEWELVVIDEAHHAAANSYQRCTHRVG